MEKGGGWVYNRCWPGSENGSAPCFSFRIARDPGANRKEPQEWLVNAGRLLGSTFRFADFTMTGVGTGKPIAAIGRSDVAHATAGINQIGRASCRERV